MTDSLAQAIIAASHIGPAGVIQSQSLQGCVTTSHVERHDSTTSSGSGMDTPDHQVNTTLIVHAYDH